MMIVAHESPPMRIRVHVRRVHVRVYVDVSIQAQATEIRNLGKHIGSEGWDLGEMFHADFEVTNINGQKDKGIKG